jgi:hypothetical protein
MSTPSAVHTAEQRSASDAFTAASNLADVLVTSARSVSVASGAFIWGVPQKSLRDGLEESSATRAITAINNADS